MAAVVGGLAAGQAFGATAENTYRAKCSTCHDAGTAGAPKLGEKVEWRRRNRNGTDPLYQAALQGKPNTAMLAKGGYSELTDAQVTAIVDYMLARAGQTHRAVYAAAKPGGQAVQPPREAPPRAANAANTDDETIAANLKALLAKTQGIVARDIKLESVGGVVTLRGVVDNAEQVRLAEATVLKVRGVRKVDNKLITKDTFAWD